jgi:hypothetical protein
MSTVDERLWSSFKKIGDAMTAQSKSLFIALVDSMAPR